VKSRQFKKVNAQKEKLDRALEVAQIQKLNAASAKDWQDVRESMQNSLSPIKKK
jgi:hypothetical protein